MIYDTLIVGGGVSGMQCALILGSALAKEYAKGKKVGIIMHQRASHLQDALFNNVLGLTSGTLGKDVLEAGKKQLNELYPEVTQIEKEKVVAVLDDERGYKVTTNKNEYYSKVVVIALNYSKPFEITGLEQYVERHIRANAMKDRIQLRNFNHLIKEGLYVCGTLAGWRSQFAIAAGSGASVATDILTVWNENVPTKVHDKYIKE
ncbi:FAD-dependent oxidoreductase [Tenacibaculum caenipelagi]|uniref:Pyridine nucleotide-disulfide oxidoreductase n=1 Tax=Tenacibaculum caenipelagi TaxID=1325435 RepID=A0A4R6TFN2_9FLAO|nr:FAD-dependent oxidoreductase [Tenacibaculum caenipelagi]TDQ28623.1 pyridine nucleotide-disulfide oxidoreductase [Tenacibaculum caenipelagi]